MIDLKDNVDGLNDEFGLGVELTGHGRELVGGRWRRG